MADYGMKVSKDGYDVKTASVKDLVMTSKANQWKIHLTGTVTGTTSQNVAHVLGYTPSYLIIDYHSSGFYIGLARPNFNSYTFSTNLVVVPPTFSGTSVGYSRYFIFKDMGA